tara:strand:+ start:133 stop:339 length:207 start_codon:yes stop_codon:yes gene_type:complete
MLVCLQREVSQIKSQPTDASLDAVLAETEARVAVLETKSAAISGAKLDPQALEHAKAVRGSCLMFRDV